MDTTQYLPFRSKTMLKITLECVICHNKLHLPPMDIADSADAGERQWKNAADAAGWIVRDGKVFCRRHAYNSAPDETK